MYDLAKLLDQGISKVGNVNIAVIPFGLAQFRLVSSGLKSKRFNCMDVLSGIY